MKKNAVTKVPVGSEESLDQGESLQTPPAEEFDWEHASLDQTIPALSLLKKKYEHAAEIVMRRQTTAPKTWTCFTQSNRESAPKSVLSQCRVKVPDGKWASKDDGAYIIKDGIKVPSPVVTCSQLCHQFYLQQKPIISLSRTVPLGG